MPTSTVAYPGRLLFLSETRDYSMKYVRLMQLTSASLDPVGIADTAHAHDTRMASADGKRVVTADGNLVDVASDSVEPLPEVAASPHLTGPTIRAASFSSDGKRLAYATDDGKIVVYDLAAKTDLVVEHGSCAYYGNDKLCGQADVLWIDPETVFAWLFSGQMPATSTCSSNGFDCSVPGADTYVIISATGKIAAQLPGGEVPLVVRGDTIVLGNGTWLDLTKVRALVVDAQPLPAGALLQSLSTDGTRIAVPGDPWRLVDIRTGAVQALGMRGQLTRDTAELAPSAWSPDGRFLAVQDWSRVIVVPVSTASGDVVGTLPSAWNPTLIGWAP
jgi:WD40 repeat protein